MLDAGEITLADDGGPTGDEPVLRYFDHEFPLRPGTEDLPTARARRPRSATGSRLAGGDEELNYRRFFDVDTLVGVRVEDPSVFDGDPRRCS